MKPIHLLSRVLLLASAAGLSSCGSGDADVTLYVALDRVHSEPVVRAFEQASGLRVDAHYDVEATKSVGLRRRIQEEASRPVCDVFWNNEVVQTVLLAEHGLLDEYRSPAAAGIPAHLKDPAGRWTGFAARGRVLIVNTEARPDPSAWPQGMAAFLLPGSSDRCGMARPLTGTTAAHAAALISRWGPEPVFELLGKLRANRVRFGPGNAHLMRLVREGELEFGWTDTDDYQVAADEGFPVARVVPDQGDGPLDFGLIVIPNTVSLVQAAPHPEAARRLIDYLLSPEVEQRLARGSSAQIPVRDDVPRPDHVLDLSRYSVAEVDWAAAGRAYSEHAAALEAFFHQ